MKAFKIDNIEIEDTFEESLSKEMFFIENLPVDKDLIMESIKCIKKRKDEYTIDGEKLQKLWFPDGFYKVFISHSHNDVNLANEISNKLSEKFGLKCFVDSRIWHNFRELEKILLSKFGTINNDISKNKIKEAVFMMLTQSLLRIMSNCEYALFLNTKDSLKDNTVTYSPWIFFELSVIDALARKNKESKIACLENKEVHFSFTPPQIYLTPLDYSDFNAAIDNIKNNDIDKLLNVLDEKYNKYFMKWHK